MNQKLIKLKKFGKILKWISFFVLSAPVCIYLSAAISLLPVSAYCLVRDFFAPLSSAFSDFEIYQSELESYDTYTIYFAMSIIPLIFSPLAMYIHAKVFGIFKFIDGQNKLSKKIIFLLLCTFLLFLVMLITVLLFFEEEIMFSFYSFSLIPAFLLYKLFQYLTKKFPKPFNKIGYYSSIEFYKSLAVKIKNRFGYQKTKL